MLSFNLLKTVRGNVRKWGGFLPALPCFPTDDEVTSCLFSLCLMLVLSLQGPSFFHTQLWQSSEGSLSSTWSWCWGSITEMGASQYGGKSAPSSKVTVRGTRPFIRYICNWGYEWAEPKSCRAPREQFPGWCGSQGVPITTPHMIKN